MSPRPAVGPAVLIRFPRDLLARIDRYAAEQGIPRAEAIRRLTLEALERHPQ